MDDPDLAIVSLSGMVIQVKPLQKKLQTVARECEPPSERGRFSGRSYETKGSWEGFAPSVVDLSLVEFPECLRISRITIRFSYQSTGCFHFTSSTLTWEEVKIYIFKAHCRNGRRVTCDSHLGSLTTQGHRRLVGVTDDSKLGSLVPTGFFKGNTFRVKNGADSPALGGDTGTWGLGVGLGWGQPLWDWGTTL